MPAAKGGLTVLALVPTLQATHKTVELALLCAERLKSARQGRALRLVARARLSVVSPALFWTQAKPIAGPATRAAPLHKAASAEAASVLQGKNCVERLASILRRVPPIAAPVTRLVERVQVAKTVAARLPESWL